MKIFSFWFKMKTSFLEVTITSKARWQIIHVTILNDAKIGFITSFNIQITRNLLLMQECKFIWIAVAIADGAWSLSILYIERHILL
jgi:hypothetical protein